MRNSRGGILLDLFLILVLCAAGAAAWRSRGRWAPPLAARWRGESQARPSAGARADLSGQSVWLQARVRESLAAAGVSEADVVKSVNVEKSDGSGRWVESTLEVRPRGTFHTGGFLGRLAPSIHAAGLAIQRDAKDGDRWMLELGDRERIFQRVIVRAAHGPTGGAAAKGTNHD